MSCVQTKLSSNSTSKKPLGREDDTETEIMFPTFNNHDYLYEFEISPWPDSQELIIPNFHFSSFRIFAVKLESL